MELDPFSLAVLTISGGFALSAYLLAYFRDRARGRASAITARTSIAAPIPPAVADNNLQHAIAQLRQRLRLNSDAEVIRAAVLLLEATCEDDHPEHLLRSTAGGREHLIRLN